MEERVDERKHWWENNCMNEWAIGPLDIGVNDWINERMNIKKGIYIYMDNKFQSQSHVEEYFRE